MYMIAYISGTVHEARALGDSVVAVTVLVQGIGFGIQIPSRVQTKVGAPLSLEVYTHYTQEHGAILFGFQTADEKALFALILSCSGIGPKLALSLVNAFSPTTFKTAVMGNNSKLLSSVEGVGAKKAESIILQLKDKVAKMQVVQEGEDPLLSRFKQLHDAFGGLGYSRLEINEVLEHLKEEDLLYKAPFPDLLRKGLAFLSSRT